MKPISLLATLFLAASAGLAVFAAEPADKAAPADPDADILAGKKPLPGLKLELFTAHKAYEVGEPIEVSMRYTYAGDRQLAIEHVTYDRCGRILGFGFTAVDEKGKAVRDPIGAYLGGAAGGLRGSGRLAPDESYSQKVFLNEWLCFDQPGRYTVTADSGIVCLDTQGTGRFHGGPGIPLKSEPLTLEITPPVDAHRLEQIERAKAALQTGRGEAAENAMRDLRFMVDDRAIPLMIEHMEDRRDNTGINAFFGLVSFRDTRVLKAKMLEAVSRRPSIPANELWSYVTLLTHIHLRERGIETERYSAARFAVEKRWREVLTERQSKSLKDMSPVEAANATVAGLAFGPTMDRNDIQNWKRILDHVESLSPERLASAAVIIEHDCRFKELIPRLKEIAANPAVNANVRAASLVALADLGDESSLDILFADITAPRQMLYNANRLLGDYRAKEVADKLLDLLEAGAGDAYGVARRLAENPYAAAAAPVDRLRKACLNSRNSSARDCLLEALVLRSPEDALDLVREVLREGQKGSAVGRRAARLLARMDFPAAQEAILAALRQASEQEREPLLRALPTAFYPEFLRLYRDDPSGKVRAEAKRALAAASGIGSTSIGPKDSIWSATAKKEEEFARRWEAWWPENAARFGRWGEVRQGLALECSTDRGVYEPGEPIWLSVRLRREAGDAAVQPEIHLSGEGLGGPRIPLPGPPLGNAPRSEATFRVDLQRTGKFQRLGSYSFRVAAVTGGDGPAPESPPLTLRLRPAPDGPKWAEPQNGLTLSACADKAAVAYAEGIALDIRLKNADPRAALTLPWPVCEPEWEPRDQGTRLDRDSALRGLSFALKDAQGKAIDLGPEPNPVAERPDPFTLRTPRMKKAEPTLIELLPGQVIRLRAAPAWRGRQLRHLAAVDSPRSPEAVSKGGKVALAVTYEIAKDAPFPPAVWRGTVTASLGEITIEPSKEPDYRRRPLSKAEEQALGLAEIKLLPRDVHQPDRDANPPK